ncbi:SH3 domain-containing protein [Adhaeribacter rhizoryzae]|uniref:SH3 domain-containing protein n=1 Tax=Adhaeribacter rhizoryzae TaxID=2607907 RepID=A0A5M6D4I6_9BACT|nr:SH3 domain-containing protein [Adhaeribacter rhizoryzae]KAA5542428.1 SH3 domain-containing protein [Adhaeribacter rhizoryzae]
MANKLSSFSLIFFNFFFILTQPVYAQENSIELKRADSLFQEHQYAQSFATYKKILDKEEKYSAQMLLKMAYTQEAQQNYTATIYYLHLYYNKRPSRAVLKKMEDLAQRQQYLGYEYSDFEFFQTQLQKYYYPILQGMLMLAVAILTIMIFIYRQKKILPGRTEQVLFLGYLLFIGFYINFLSFGRKGIIRQNGIAIMAAPAAGARWLATTNQGHRINLKGERDIWYETEWNGQRAFIRKKNVLELP